ncbi:MAG: membrane protein insertion efficiency factor YidD [Clostridia bacterium]|nr:membrane protein insertion efficiency factor YidD [Candidatus Pelethousia sp.]NCB30427.1 membrane protein insertion efficiency factor YidD [Clostridia bacterium]
MKVLFQRLLLFCIEYYRLYISPRHPGCCRYSPTCSAYAKEAIERFGPFKGSGLALWRILRCNPFSKGGYDPVPLRKGAGPEQEH